MNAKIARGHLSMFPLAGPAPAHLSWVHLPVPLVVSQVNITLLDINDNHPTWKDAPYYINLVEMTPPDSDVTTVGGGRAAEPLGGSSQGCVPLPPRSQEACPYGAGGLCVPLSWLLQ